MTKREKIVVSAYTGILMCDWGDLHEYIESILERPVQTFELRKESIWEEIRKKSEHDFMEICELEET